MQNVTETLRRIIHLHLENGGAKEKVELIVVFNYLVTTSEKKR